MGLQLFEHNQIAYEAADVMMEKKGRAAVIHPTGTGKSFIAFKLAEDHPAARICWLGPSKHIYHAQLENVSRTLSPGETVSFGNISFLSYSKLLKKSVASEGSGKAHGSVSMEELALDYIVLDEFHRCGAPEWGKGVNKLLAMFPNAKILGLSATNIRYLDGRRDMAEEIFDGCIASEMTLGEAVVRGILSAPRYVTALYSYEKALDGLEQKVKEAGGHNTPENVELLERLRRTLEQADGLDKVFARHMDRRDGKYIVFCTGKDHMNEMRGQASEWFRLIDDAPHIYTVYHNSPNTEKELAAFRADDSEHLKLLFCIDMLNEGMHVAGLDGVILLRPTISPIIYLQQVGRALSAGTAREPVIFDLVDNFESLACTAYLEQELDEAFSLTGAACVREGKEGWNGRFRITDEAKDCRKLFGQLQANLASVWDIYYRAAAEYYRNMGNLLVPKAYITSDGLALGSWVHAQRKAYVGRRDDVSGKPEEDRIRRLDAIGMVWDVRDGNWEEAYRELTAYYRQYGNVDVKARYCCENGFRLGRWVSNLRAKIKEKGLEEALTGEQRGKLEALGMVWDRDNEKWDTYLRAAKEYHMRHGNLKVPVKYVTEEGVALGSWLQAIRHGRAGGKCRVTMLSAEQMTQLEALGIRWEKDNKVLWDMKFGLAKEYYEQNGNLDIPVAYCVDGVKLGRWISNIRAKRRNPESSGIVLDEERIRQLDSIGMDWK